MDEAKQQLLDKLKTSNNILISVSRNPSVDQLASCLGLALFLNKQGKHCAAVFSGKVPSTIEFLQPEETLEKNTDSLRDFIIALDKSKADKLRYKVEDNVVRIFITPYKTSISEADLDFSQGDFNVDLVVALGVTSQEDLDEAITAHGRILHDATVASVNIAAEGGLGSINWHDTKASSLCEMVTDLAKTLDPGQLDAQISTALLTGIVAETKRFSNDKTTSQTMSAGSALMAAGANQQLVANKLDEPEQPHSIQKTDDDSETTEGDDGTIEIEHEQQDDQEPDQPIELPSPDLTSEATEAEEPAEEPAPEEPKPEEPKPEEPALPEITTLSPGSKLVTGPPSMGGTLTANSQPSEPDPVTDPMSMPKSEQPQMLEHSADTSPSFSPAPIDWSAPVASTDPPAATPADPVVLPPAPDPVPTPADNIQPDTPEPSLSQIEEEVAKSEAEARDEVSRALNTGESSSTPKPIQALNAQPMADNLNSSPTLLPTGPQTPAADVPASEPQVTDSTAPPPVPPPIPFQFGNTNPPQQ